MVITFHVNGNVHYVPVPFVTEISTDTIGLRPLQRVYVRGFFSPVSLLEHFHLHNQQETMHGWLAFPQLKVIQLNFRFKLVTTAIDGYRWWCAWIKWHGLCTRFFIISNNDAEIHVNHFIQPLSISELLRHLDEIDNFIFHIRTCSFLIDRHSKFKNKCKCPLPA